MSAEELDFGVALAIANAAVLDQLTRHMAAEGYDGFTPRHGAVLRLVRTGPVSLRELASRLEMTSPGALKLVTGMTEGGYLERVATSSDRRLRLVSMSARGQEALAAARDFHAAFEAELVRSLGADVVGGARAVLEHVVGRESSVVPAVLRRAAGSM